MSSSPKTLQKRAAVQKKHCEMCIRDSLQEGEIQRLIWQLKQSDKKAVEKHLKGYAWEFDYEKMFSILTQNPVCQKVCQKNKYTSWMHLISRYCTEDC